MKENLKRKLLWVHFKLSYGPSYCGRWGQRPRRTAPVGIPTCRFFPFLFNARRYTFNRKQIMKRIKIFLQKLNKKRLLLIIIGQAFFISVNIGLAFGQDTRVSIHSNPFPNTIQFSPPSSGKLNEDSGRMLTIKTPHSSINDIIKQGFSNFWIYNLSGDNTRSLLKFAQSRGMEIDYMTSGFEGFDRNHPPVTSVYAPQYKLEVKKKVDSGLAPLREIQRISTVFPFQDEPFHGGPESFDYSSYAKAEFKKRYGYQMPENLESVRNAPRKWLDLLNFQSDTFRDGWKQVYKIVKGFDPRPKIVMTHDSHNSFGAGVKSNSKVAIDDVFHWGGDFADILAYDIYPYMTFDYRYGELGKLPKPRISQMHYTISQLRNVATAYGKELGFWVGTYSDKWFDRFRGLQRKNQYWSEREMSYTAIGQGANFLISPSNYNTTNLPLDSMHWEDYGKAMNVIQKAGRGLLEAPKMKAKACFLFPRTQYLQLQEEFFNVGVSYELFLRAFGEMDIIHEEQITSDNLNGYKVLVLADVKLLPTVVARHIAAFVQKGGIVISDCVPQMDAFKQPLNVMTKLFGVSHSATNRLTQEGQWVPFTTLPAKMSFPPPSRQSMEQIKRDIITGVAFGKNFAFPVVSPRAIEITTGKILLKMQSGQPGLIYNKSGKGRSYLFGFCIQDTYFRTWKDNNLQAREQLRNLISDVFTDSKIRSHVYSSNADIEASLRANAKEAYLFIINHEATDPETKVSIADLQFIVHKIVDVESGSIVEFKRKIGEVEFSIKAPYGTTKILKVLP